MSPRGHSSKVHIRLYVDEHIVRVAQVGPKRMILRESFECPPETVGQIVVVVDGHYSRYPIILDHGISPGDVEVTFSDIAPVERIKERPLLTELEDCPF
jgi:hypothetical protein